MKLYTRLVESGVFIFWSSDGADTSFQLKISITVGEEKIPLLIKRTNVGENFYSFDRIGSGDYEIELNAYRGGRLYQTEVKNVKIIASVQKTEETMTELNGSIHLIAATLANVNGNICDLYNLLRDLDNSLTDPKTIVKIRERVDKIERDRW